MTAVDAAEARLAALETTANLAWWDMACEATDATSAAAETASATMSVITAPVTASGAAFNARRVSAERIPKKNAPTRARTIAIPGHTP